MDTSSESQTTELPCLYVTGTGHRADTHPANSTNEKRRVLNFVIMIPFKPGSKDVFTEPKEKYREQDGMR